MQPRRRGGSFREGESEDGSNNIQFVTPYYDGHTGPEPLDLSKLRLDNMDSEDNDSSEEEEEEEEEEEDENYVRGRSRSRSIHTNDSCSGFYILNEGGQSDSSEPAADGCGDDGGKGQGGKVERTGPLQHREVVALQKVMSRQCIINNL